MSQLAPHWSTLFIVYIISVKNFSARIFQLTRRRYTPPCSYEVKPIHQGSHVNLEFFPDFSRENFIFFRENFIFCTTFVSQQVSYYLCNIGSIFFFLSRDFFEQKFPFGSEKALIYFSTKLFFYRIILYRMLPSYITSLSCWGWIF